MVRKKYVQGKSRKNRSSKQKCRNDRRKTSTMNKVLRALLQVPWVNLILLTKAAWPVVIRLLHHLINLRF